MLVSCNLWPPACQHLTHIYMIYLTVSTFLIHILKRLMILVTSGLNSDTNKLHSDSLIFKTVAIFLVTESSDFKASLNFPVSPKTFPVSITVPMFPCGHVPLPYYFLFPPSFPVFMNFLCFSNFPPPPTCPYTHTHKFFLFSLTFHVFFSPLFPHAFPVSWLFLFYLNFPFPDFFLHVPWFFLFHLSLNCTQCLLNMAF